MTPELAKRKNLGRGLSALFGEQDGLAPAEGAAPARATFYPVEFLAPSPLQPRRNFDEAALEELAGSIAEKGVLQPLLIRPNRSQPGHYEIVAGERRWRAAQRAKLHEVPALVKDLTDAEVLEVALIENLQRRDLSPIEEARGYERLINDFGHTQDKLATIVGKSRSHVANMLRLLTLPDTVLQMIDHGQLAMGQARPLIGLAGAEAAARQIVKRGLSARQAERLAKGFGHKRKLAPIARDADTVALEKSLEQATGYQVRITFDGKGGTVTLNYANLEQLDDIARRLSSSAGPGRIPVLRAQRDGETDDLEDVSERKPPERSDLH